MLFWEKQGSGIQELFNQIDEFLLPMDPEAMDNIGLPPDKHKKLFLSLTFMRNEVENILENQENGCEDPRVQATNLKIIEGLMRHIGINPAAKGAAKKVMEILLESDINLDEKTIRERLKKIKENTTATSSAR